MMDRWWPALFLLGLALLALAWPFYSDLYTRLTEAWRWETMAGVGAVVLLISLIMLVMRKSAYVQPCGDHLLLATPFSADEDLLQPHPPRHFRQPGGLVPAQKLART